MLSSPVCCGLYMPLAFHRPRPSRLAFALLLAATSAQAHVDLDLSYVDTGGAKYTRFKNWVDAAVGGSPGYAFSATDAAFMAELDGDASYCTLAVQMVEQQVSDAEALIAMSQRPAVSYDSYLEVGDMIRDLAITYDWCEIYTTAPQRTRWANYAEQAVWNVWNPNNAEWGGNPFPWSGWSINDPGNNYYYSFLEATISWAQASDSTTWKNFIATQKIPPLQDYFALLPGGGSSEGTGYGTSHMRLFWLYRLWRDAEGSDPSASNTHRDNSILYWAHATVPGNDRFAPIGDQARVSEPVLFDYQRRLMLEARALSTDPTTRYIASGWLNRISVDQMEQGFNFRHDLLDAGSSSAFPTTLHYLAEGTRHLFARTIWQPDAWWISFVAGRFEQSHAHEDQGSFTFYGEGTWQVVTENIWSHSGIEQGGEVHNLLRFDHNGQPVRQQRGTASSMSAVRQMDGSLSVHANLLPAYDGQTGVNAWTRDLSFDANGLVVDDLFSIDAQTTATFQLNLPEAPIIVGNHVHVGALDIEVELPEAPTFNLIDWHALDAGEFNSGYRLDIGGSNSHYRVILRPVDRVFADGFEGDAP